MTTEVEQPVQLDGDVVGATRRLTVRVAPGTPGPHLTNPCRFGCGTETSEGSTLGASSTWANVAGCLQLGSRQRPFRRAGASRRARSTGGSGSGPPRILVVGPHDRRVVQQRLADFPQPLHAIGRREQRGVAARRVARSTARRPRGPTQPRSCPSSRTAWRACPADSRGRGACHEGQRHSRLVGQVEGQVVGAVIAHPEPPGNIDRGGSRTRSR